MSIRATVWAWRVQGITAPQKVVLARYADLAATDGSGAWCPVRRLVRQTCLSERTVRHALRGLEAAGLITVTTPADVATHRTMTYRLNIPADFDHMKPEDDGTPGAGDAPALGREMPQPPAGDAPAPRQEMPQAGAGDAPNTAYNVPKRRSNNKRSASALPRADAQPAINDLLIEEEATKPEADIVDQMLAIYKELLGELLSVPLKITPQRRKAALARYKDSLGSDISTWRHVCERVAASPFLTGQAPGKSFRADFDFLLGEHNLLKLAEGKYDDHAPARPAGPPSKYATLMGLAADMEAAEAGGSAPPRRPRDPRYDADRRIDPGIRWAMGKMQGRDRLDDVDEVFDRVIDHQEITR